MVLHNYNNEICHCDTPRGGEAISSVACHAMRLPRHPDSMGIPRNDIFYLK